MIEHQHRLSADLVCIDCDAAFSETRPGRASADISREVVHAYVTAVGLWVMSDEAILHAVMAETRGAANPQSIMNELAVMRKNMIRQ